MLQQEGAENPYELFMAEPNQLQPVQLSSPTLRVYEDFFQGLALAVQRDCLQKRENYTEQEFFDLADYCCSQGQVMTIQKQCVDEARRMALQAQIRGALLQVRTLLSQVDQNCSPFILEGKTDGQQFGIFLSSQEGAQLASLTTLPHPASLMLDQYSDLQLEIILTYLECVEAIVRFGLLKTRLQGQTVAEAGKRVQELLEFAFEIGKIHLGDAGQPLQVPSTAYLEPADVEFLELQARECERLEDCADTARTAESAEKARRRARKRAQTCLEQAKTYLVVKKALELRNTLELSTRCAREEAEKIMARKGLRAHSGQGTAENRAIDEEIFRKTKNALSRILDIAEERAELRRLGENLRAPVTAAFPWYSRNGGFEEAEGPVPLHPVARLCVSQARCDD